jgi:uncharacterized protein YndB with AHSA1/START domain
MASSILLALTATLRAGPDGPDAAAVPPDTSPIVHEGILHAPPAEVWKVWATSDGFKALGVAKADVDLRVGGLIRSTYDAKRELDDTVIHNRIIAYEPERMMALRIEKPPRGFPFKEAWKDTWTVVTLTDLGDGRTHLRIAGLGYTEGEESQAMRRFFQTGNDWTMKKLAAHFDAAKAKEIPAKAHGDRPLAPVEIDSVVAAACDDVWSALTTTRGWKAFLDVDSRIELRPGGPFEIHFKPDAPAGSRGSETCTVLGYDPGRMLSFTWNAPPDLPHARERHTWVVMTLEPLAGKTTRVRLRHMGFEEVARAIPEHAGEVERARAYFTAAWPRILGALRAHYDKSAR